MGVQLTTLSEWLTKNPKLLVFTGAGSSADSGIATFRGDTGLWENHDVDVVANGYTWRDNFEKIRNFYNSRRTQLSTVSPNSIHYAIADWQKRYDSLVITQNIDDLLERAGCTDVVHVHGVLTMMKCVACGNTWDIGYTEWGADDRCGCGSRKGVRPNVVFFNEDAPEYAKMYRAFSKARDPNDCVVVIGTSGQVIAVDEMLIGSKALKIVNNLESSKYINENMYDSVLFGRASETAEQLSSIISKHIGI